MKVLGFRADPTATRYAIVNFDGSTYSFVNASDETRLTYPAGIEQVSGKVLWLYREIERIFHANSDIAVVVIKTNEYGLTEKAAMRESSYAEAAVALLCEQRGMPVFFKTYGSLCTRSVDVKAHAEQRIGRTVKYWDNKIADAVVAAWWGTRQL